MNYHLRVSQFESGKKMNKRSWLSLYSESRILEDFRFEQGDFSVNYAPLFQSKIPALTDLTRLQKVQAEMDDLCTNIHNFYDNLETQKNVFLYHGAALKIAQNYTPRFVSFLLIL